MQHPQFSHPLMISCVMAGFEEDDPGMAVKQGKGVLGLERELLPSRQSTNPCHVSKRLFLPQQEYSWEKWDFIPSVLLTVRKTSSERAAELKWAEGDLMPQERINFKYSQGH